MNTNQDECGSALCGKMGFCDRHMPGSQYELLKDCRNQTLEEAAQAVEHQVGTLNYAAVIRALKK